jgi:hypothetical protein
VTAPTEPTTVTGATATPAGQYTLDDALMDRAAKMARSQPEVFAWIKERIKAEHDSLVEHRREQHRLAAAKVRVQAISIGLGFLSVVILAIVAWHFADIGQATAGAAIITGGAVSIAAVFVTGQVISGRRGARVDLNESVLSPSEPSEN